MGYLNNNKNNDLSFSTKNTEKINGRKEISYDCGKITQIALKNYPGRHCLSLDRLCVFHGVCIQN